jgi:hypothetical protein
MSARRESWDEALTIEIYVAKPTVMYYWLPSGECPLPEGLLGIYRLLNQSSWLQIQRCEFDSRHYQIFWEVALEWCPLSLVNTTEELLGRKSCGSGLEKNREYGRMDPSRWLRGTLYPQKLALTSPTRGGSSIGIVRSQTKATEFSFLTLVNVGHYLQLSCNHCLAVTFLLQIEPSKYGPTASNVLKESTNSIFHPEDRGSRFFRNAGKYYSLIECK